MRKPYFSFLILIGSLFINISYAAVPTFNCTLTDTIAADGAPSAAKNSFTKMTPMIYLVCQSDQVHKGEKVKTTWIAEDTHNVAPANYQIDEKSFDIESNLTSGQVWTLHASVSKPNSNWPAGSYHVDLYVDNALSQSVKFTIP